MATIFHLIGAILVCIAPGMLILLGEEAKRLHQKREKNKRFLFPFL